MTGTREIPILRAHGNVIPEITVAAAHIAGLELAVLAAVLEQESGGGNNEFGHDPVRKPQIVGGPVTHARYARYKLLRRLCGAQGVGPMQLTYPGYQDQADKIGGCWDPACNVRVGAGIVADHIRRAGLHMGLASYNGSGPAAEHYADTVVARVEVWRTRLAPPPARPKPKPRAPLPAKPTQGNNKTKPVGSKKPAKKTP